MGILSNFLRKRRLKHVLEFKWGSRFLDIGCGSGSLLDYIISIVSTPPGMYVGVDKDISPATEKFVVEDRGYYILPDFVDFIQQDINEGVNVKGKYSTIVLSAVVEHIKDPVKVLKSIRKNLSPLGSVIITTPTPRSKSILEFGSKIGLFNNHDIEEHEKYYSRDELFEICYQAGYKIMVYYKFEFGLNQIIVIEKI